MIMVTMTINIIKQFVRSGAGGSRPFPMESNQIEGVPPYWLFEIHRENGVWPKPRQTNCRFVHSTPIGLLTLPASGWC